MNTSVRYGKCVVCGYDRPINDLEYSEIQEGCVCIKCRERAEWLAGPGRNKISGKIMTKEELLGIYRGEDGEKVES